MKQDDVSLNDIQLFEDFQKDRPDLVGPNPKGAYHLIQRRKENGLEQSGALIKGRGRKNFGAVLCRMYARRSN